MCFSLTSLLKACGFFQQPLLPSFYDRHLHIDHDHDAELQTLFASINVPQTHAEYNPPPEKEVEVYERCAKPGNMIQRNILLMSRWFIQHARERELGRHFLDKRRIRILDVGCGLAPTLPGILVYFNKLGIEVSYLGLDLDPGFVRECQGSYGHLTDVSFVHGDMLDFVEDIRHQHQFDLLLCQHPNIENPVTRRAFLAFFRQQHQLLADGGICYSTLYYESEKRIFEQELLADIGGSLHDTRPPGVRVQNIHTGEHHFPESFVYMSEPQGQSLSKKMC